MKLKPILTEINKKDDYSAPPKQVVWRAEHANKSGNWFAFSKDDAAGYANYGSKMVKADIGNLKFIGIAKILEYGEYFDEIVDKFPDLFKAVDNGQWIEYELDVGLTTYFEKIANFLENLGYDGVFTYKKLSIDYEIYIFKPKIKR